MLIICLIISYVAVGIFNYCAAIGFWNGFRNIYLKNKYPRVWEPRDEDQKHTDIRLAIEVAATFIAGTIVVLICTDWLRYGFDYKLRDEVVE